MLLSFQTICFRIVGLWFMMNQHWWITLCSSYVCGNVAERAISSASDSTCSERIFFFFFARTWSGQCNGLSKQSHEWLIYLEMRRPSLALINKSSKGKIIADNWPLSLQWYSHSYSAKLTLLSVSVLGFMVCVRLCESHWWECFYYMLLTLLPGVIICHYVIDKNIFFNIQISGFSFPLWPYICGYLRYESAITFHDFCLFYCSCRESHI